MDSFAVDSAVASSGDAELCAFGCTFCKRTQSGGTVVAPVHAAVSVAVSTADTAHTANSGSTTSVNEPEEKKVAMHGASAKAGVFYRRTWGVGKDVASSVEPSIDNSTTTVKDPLPKSIESCASGRGCSSRGRGKALHAMPRARGAMRLVRGSGARGGRGRGNSAVQRARLPAARKTMKAIK